MAERDKALRMTVIDPSRQRGEDDTVDPEISRIAGSPTDSVGDPSAGILARLESHAQKKMRYSLKGEIARGGMGVVLKVWDEDLRRNLAMKVVLGDEAGHPTGTPASSVKPKLLARFLEEAQVTAQLDHPGIVPVHELGLDDRGRVYFTMQLVKGKTLHEVIDESLADSTEWNQTRVLMVMLKVCEAMAYSHTKGVLHRDLKPDNIMVGRFGEVYVMDWGLARVMGREDLRDIRLEAPTAVSIVDSDRHEQAGESDYKSTLYTMDGDVVGTPAYMSPEQARGEIEILSPSADVYSTGAMLYHLLTGQPPYTPAGIKRLSQHMVWRWVLEGPPQPVHELAKEVPAELAAICEKAMERDVSDRYANMIELSEDLRAYLEHRVVHAYETGAVAEFRKWISRNKGLATASAAALVLALGGLTAVGWIQSQGKRAEQVLRTAAEDSAEEALLQERVARLEREKVLRLSAFQDLEELELEAETLWPARPDLVPRYESWLDRAEVLVAGLESIPGEEIGGHFQTLSELRERAIPATPEEVEADRRAHPRYEEYVNVRNRRDVLRRARAVRDATAVPEEPQLAPGPLRSTFQNLQAIAWELVDPERLEFGREAEGLALALQALEIAPDSSSKAGVSDTIAWAYYALGQDDFAFAAIQDAIDQAPGSERRDYEERAGELELAVGAARGEKGLQGLEAVEAELVEVESDVSRRLTWHFSDPDDAWWHSQLERLVSAIQEFSDPDTGLIGGVSPRFGWGIERRLEFASSLEERTIAGVRARQLWTEAIASIADERECPRYGGLRIRPQIGLLPIGRDVDSGLWEFAHLLSGAIPTRGRNEQLLVNDGMALVFVLLPGGTFLMGAQPDDPGGANFDPQARPREGPVHEVALAPFFVSKFEMTQGQWERFRATNPSQAYAGGPRDPADERHPIGFSNPVEQVSWEECREVLPKMGLVLPTEAQWEYAARAGTDTPWWTGSVIEDLRGAANVADKSGMDRGASWKNYDREIADDYYRHAPVGTFDANEFGLQDVHGNVFEWCEDRFAPYDFSVRPGDGLRRIRRPEDLPIARGGAWNYIAFNARSAERLYATPQLKSPGIGLRPVRVLNTEP